MKKNLTSCIAASSWMKECNRRNSLIICNQTEIVHLRVQTYVPRTDKPTVRVHVYPFSHCRV